MFVTISRPPNDTFTFRLFFGVAKKLQEADYFYIWAPTLESSKNQKNWDSKELEYRNTLFNCIHSNIIVLGLKDHLTPSWGFDPNTESMPEIASYINDLTSYYSDKKFIIFSSLEKLEIYLKNENTFIIPWGGDITNQMSQYKNIDPVLDKNLDSTNSFISLNRNPRFHRAMAIYIMLALDLDKLGMISCLFKNSLHYLNDVHFWEKSQEIQNLIDIGIEKIAHGRFLSKDDINIYHKERPNDNAANFKNKLCHYYRETFIEFVNETSFTEEYFLITEKTLNSVYGCNFPIWLSSAGTVEFLRDIGLDVFDDIIDHSYDKIKDPSLRVHRAIRDNLDLLRDIEKTKIIWNKHKDRFEKNVVFVKERMYDIFSERALNQFDRIINTI